MTVLRPRDLTPAGRTGSPATRAVDAAEAVELGALDLAADATRDAIVLSLRASTLLRAGLAVRALIIDALTLMQRSVRLGSRTVVLEFGVYR